jgi:hypothetical protein
MAITKQQSALRKNSSSPGEDDVLNELYAERDAYAAEHGHDLNRIYADLKAREAQSSLRRFIHSEALPVRLRDARPQRSPE